MISLRRNLRRKAGVVIVAGLGVCSVLVAGCGGEVAVNSAPVSSSSQHATVPSIAATYASIVGLTLKSSVTQGSAVLAQMKTWHPTSLSIPCGQLGQQLAYQYAAFKQMYTPSYAHAAAMNVIAGYKLALSGLDECGNAADGNDSKAMKVAAGDFAKGLSEISAGQRVIAAWTSAAR
jgi:hypothetical protein